MPTQLNGARMSHRDTSSPIVRPGAVGAEPETGFGRRCDGWIISRPAAAGARSSRKICQGSLRLSAEANLEGEPTGCRRSSAHAPGAGLIGGSRGSPSEEKESTERASFRTGGCAPRLHNAFYLVARPYRGPVAAADGRDPDGLQRRSFVTSSRAASPLTSFSGSSALAD